MGSKDFQHKQTENKSATPPMDYNNMSLKGTNGEVPSDLFDSKAEQIAKSLNPYLDKNGVTGTSLRRIFDEAKRFQQILGDSDADFAGQLPYIKMIKSKTAYTVARQKNSLAYKRLRDFIFWGINQIKTKNDYEIFISLFEAVYGYYYEYAPKEKDR